MAQKITLSIPDILHEKLKKWRTSFNFSKMFQDTLTEAIQKKEAFRKRFSEDFDMSEIIKRLKHEKLIWEKKYYEIGKAEGLQWAKTAHYEDLLYVSQFDTTYRLISDLKMNQYFEQIYQSTDFVKYSNSDSLNHKQIFTNGWFKGVLEFWNQIEEKI